IIAHDVCCEICCAYRMLKYDSMLLVSLGIENNEALEQKKQNQGLAYGMQNLQ
ncbi:hypothetical protein Tco_0028579, partial [Tanacetum coccineum]